MATIAPLNPYNGETHVRITLINLDVAPAVAHFHLGHYEGEASDQWVERAELNCCNLPPGITSLEEIVSAISDDLQLHA